MIKFLFHVHGFQYILHFQNLDGIKICSYFLELQYIYDMQTLDHWQVLKIFIFSFPSFLFPLLISIMFIIFNRETPSRECFSNVWQSSEVWFNSVLPPNLIIMSFFALPQQPRRFQLAWGLLKVFLCVLLIW